MIHSAIVLSMGGSIADSLEILERLVGFDTSSHKTNLPLVHWVKGYLDRHGVASELLPDASGEKLNLIARIGDASARGIVLSGHTDVVPADPGRWSSDPFSLRRLGDRVFGRGTTDMKGFLSVVLAAVPDMKAADLQRPIILAFSHDEEVGCLGTPGLMGALPAGQEVIVGEPTRLRPGIRHKGARLQTLAITGVPAHSGTPEQGVNAIEYGQRAIAGLIDLGNELAAQDGAFPSNLTVTAAKGGSAPNIVPPEFEVTWMFRPASNADAADVGAKIARIAAMTTEALETRDPRAGAVLSTVCDVPPLCTEVSAMSASVRNVLTQAGPPVSLDFATEAGIFHEGGHDVIVCGPGDMAEGHTDDEFIEISALEAGRTFIGDVIDAAST